MQKTTKTITNDVPALETTQAVDLHSCGEGTGTNIGFLYSIEY